MQTNNLRHYRVFGLAVIAAALSACGGPESSSTGGPGGGPVPTSSINISLTVESDDSQTTVVKANLNNGHSLGGSFRLDGGDYLRACIGGVCRTMSDNNSIYTPDYIARFDYQPGIDHVVSFNRREGRNAPDTRVALPPSFTIVTPANRQQVTDGETVIVEWSPTGAPARVGVSYRAECRLATGSDVFSAGTVGTDFNRDGRESVGIDGIISAARVGSVSNITRCSIDITIAHELQGRVDPAFDGGSAKGVVSRKVTLDYVPR
jgi:hypothetical protein